ncbi:MAG: ribonuclease H-like domain-containing protein [Chloroflexota bacterium]
MTGCGNDAYLDIETTGLSPTDSYITVVGIYLCGGGNSQFIQLVGEDVTPGNILNALKDVDTLYTYNGSRFDLPFIQSALGVELGARCLHRDLMYDCWRNNLYGGFKSVEAQLGIPRQTKGVDGWEAVKLWWRHQAGDSGALDLLLRYNREDVLNLKALRERLAR